MNIKKKNEATIKNGSIIETKEGTFFLVAFNVNSFIVLVNLKTYYVTSSYASIDELSNKKNIVNVFNNNDLYLG